MSVRPTSLPVPMAGGIDTKNDDKSVPLESLLVLENGVFDRGGTSAKRNGYEAMVSDLIEGGQMPAAEALTSRDDELLAFAQRALYSYSSAVDKWHKVGLFQSVEVTQRTVAKRASNQTQGDCATVNGVACYVWADDDDGIWYQTSVAATGAVIKAPTQLDALGVNPRVLAIGNNFVILFAKGASLWSTTIPTVTPASVFAVEEIADDLGSELTYDAHSDGTKAALAWGTSSGTGKLAYLHESGSIGGAVNGLASPTSWTAPVTRGPAVAIDVEGAGNVAVVWGEAAASSRIWVVDSSLSEVHPVDDVDASAVEPGRLAVQWERADDSNGDRVAQVFWDVENASAPLDLVRWRSFSDGGAASTTSERRGVSLASRAFVDGGDVFVNLVHSSDQFAVLLTMRADALVVARALSGRSVGRQARRHLPGVATTSRQHSFVATYQERLEGANDDVFSEKGLRRLTLDFDATDRHQAAQLGASLYIGGGYLHEYDGAVVAEAEYHWAPEPPAAPTEEAPGGEELVLGTILSGASETSVQLSTTIDSAKEQTGVLVIELDSGDYKEVNYTSHAGDTFTIPSTDFSEDFATGGNAVIYPTGGVDIGTHLYAVVYETVTERGELKRGAVSPFLTVEVEDARKAQVFELPTLGVTGWSNTQVALYRSRAGESDALYRVTSLDPSATGRNGYAANDETVDSVSFTDDLDDAALETKNPLYTNGGILSNDPVPACKVITTGKTRLFANSSDDENLIRFSQELGEGVTVEMSAVRNAIRTPARGGKVVAISELDSAVIVFKETAIYAFGGPGPLANPDAGGGFSVPELITSDVGCSSARSVATTPNGLVFQSAKGIHLLNRSRQVQYIGAPVEGFTDANRGGQSIVAATLAEDRRHIRFLSSSGQGLLWDYFFNRWCSWTNHYGLDALTLGNLHYYVRPDGAVWRETPGLHADAGKQIAHRIGPAWVRFGGLLASEQMVWRLSLVGTFKSPHTLKVKLYYDYETGARDEMTIDPAEFISQPLFGEGQFGQGKFGGEAEQRYEMDIHVGERCRAFRFTVEDVEAPGVTGAAYEMSGAIVQGGVIKRGAVVAETRMG